MIATLIVNGMLPPMFSTTMLLVKDSFTSVFDVSVSQIRKSARFGGTIIILTSVKILNSYASSKLAVFVRVFVYYN